MLVAVEDGAVAVPRIIVDRRLAPVSSGRSIQGIASSEDGGHLFVTLATGDGQSAASLRVLDVTDPRSAVEAASLQLPSSRGPGKLQRFGSWLFVDRGYELELIDAADPLVPRFLGALESEGGLIAAIEARGDRLYLARWTGFYDNLGIFVLDLTDPPARERVGGTELSISQVGDFGLDAYMSGGMALQGEQLWVATDDGRLTAFDVHSQLPTIPQRGRIDAVGQMTDLEIDGHRLYGADRYFVQTLDIADPDAPVVQGHVATDYYYRDIQVGGGAGFFPIHGQSDVMKGQMQIADSSQPGSPRVMAQWEVHHLPRIALSLPWLAVLRDDFNSLAQELLLYDVGNPIRPVVVDRRWLHLDDDRLDIEWSSGRLLLAAQDDNGGAATLRSFELSNGQLLSDRALELRSPVGADSSFQDPALAADDGLALVVSHARAAGAVMVTARLHIVDVSMPDRLLLRAEIDLPEPITAIAFRSGFAFLAGRSGVYIVDIRDPAAPAIVDLLPTPAFAGDKGPGHGLQGGTSPAVGEVSSRRHQP